MTQISEILTARQLTARLASELMRRTAEVLHSEADRLDDSLAPSAGAERLADAAILLELVTNWRDDPRRLGEAGDTPLAAVLAKLLAEVKARGEVRR